MGKWKWCWVSSLKSSMWLFSENYTELWAGRTRLLSTGKISVGDQDWDVRFTKYIGCFLEGPHSAETRMAWQFIETMHDTTDSPVDAFLPAVSPTQESLPPCTGHFCLVTPPPSVFPTREYINLQNTMDWPPGLEDVKWFPKTLNLQSVSSSDIQLFWLN